MTKQQLAEHLSGLFTPETLLAEYSSTGVDGRLLRGTLAQVGPADIMPKRVPLCALQSFRNSLAGLPRYSLPFVFSIVYADDFLWHQAHWADADALMLQRLVNFLMLAMNREFLTIPSSRANVLLPLKAGQTGIQSLIRDGEEEGQQHTGNHEIIDLENDDDDDDDEAEEEEEEIDD
ncbi:MAG: hypothetical protein M1823_001580 [Watsoniomyces obsoletus]|nr:MAG: hypothetical protein M1823_001580 [Watsoniomyces obsoletus]